MTDPHADEYCVVCGSEPIPGRLRMYPVVGIEDGCVCTDCIEGEEA